ncbi:sialate O-acetylesterase [Rubritalea tangerina]|uniref:Sialate O-acetylesterase n=2 Tax=Rubritalea tangerina TaxID=430798 RepID=A0ABW4Z8R0_9BACT
MRLLTSILLLVLPLTAAEVDVYLLGGQSNMQGIGKIAQLPNAQDIDLSRTHFFTGKGFETIQLGKTKTSARPADFGPEIGFGQVMNQKGKEIYIIKYFASGMPLHPGWNRNKWVGLPAAPKRTNFYPGTNAQDPNKGRLYLAMQKRFASGVQSLKAAGHTPKIRGFLWMQGEQDSKNQTSATTYAKHLKLLKNRLSEDMNVDPLPLVFGQVLPYTPALDRFTHRTEIRQQMAAADSKSGKSESIPTTTMVSTDPFPLLKDKVHYNAEGQLLLGQAFADAMLELQK